MPTIKELTNLKAQIDAACEELTNRLNNKYTKLYADEKVIICYHNHFKVPAWSIYLQYNNLTEDFRDDDVIFCIDPLVPERIQEDVQNDIIAGMEAQL